MRYAISVSLGLDAYVPFVAPVGQWYVRRMRRRHATVRVAALIGVALCVSCANSSHSDRPRATRTPSPTATASPSPTLAPPTPTPALAVARVVPAAAPFQGGTATAIEGVGFHRGVRSVRFGDREATRVLVVSDQRISAIAPPGAAGATVPVTVVFNDGRTATGGAFQYVGGTLGRTLTIEPVGLPDLAFDARIGTSRVLFDYVVRDGLGRPVPPSEYRVRLFLDGNRLGTGAFDETVLGSDARELELNLFLMLVLDASYSLERFTRPQFTAMLQAAENLVLRGADLWSRRSGRFDWSVLWFNDLLARPDPAHLDTFRLLNIPPPAPGDFTKLYSAISAGLQVSTDLRSSGVAAGTRDRHVLVVFTDGRDNLSNFANPTVEESGRLGNGDPFRRFGWPATDLSRVLQEIAAHPASPQGLTVHTVGLGASCIVAASPCFDQVALGQIAQVGLGQTLDAFDDVISLFHEISGEFETLKTDGAILALAPATYAFDVVVERLDGSASGELGFLFSIGDRRADFLRYR